MTVETNVKELVKEKYGEIAVKSRQNGGCGCSPEADVGAVVSDSYANVEGYVAEADLGLGCGLPTEHAGIKPGDTVVDLGSGAGNDVFVARALTGDSGKVIGVDMTREMVARANENKEKLGYSNVEFHLGEIEALPLADNRADVIVSNCVLNLVPDKRKAFAEIHRVLKHGAHFCISDIVIQGDFPENLKESAELYVGCVAGALHREEYLGVIRNAGFHNVEVRKSKTIDLPDNVLSAYLSAETIAQYRGSGAKILSITVVGKK